MMKQTTLRYELSSDGMGLKEYVRTEDGDELFYHVHSDEFTELQKWIHGLLSLALGNFNEARECLSEAIEFSKNVEYYEPGFPDIDRWRKALGKKAVP
jgi:hypothetical protein